MLERKFYFKYNPYTHLKICHQWRLDYCITEYNSKVSLQTSWKYNEKTTKVKMVTYHLIYSTAILLQFLDKGQQNNDSVSYILLTFYVLKEKYYVKWAFLCFTPCYVFFFILFNYLTLPYFLWSAFFDTQVFLDRVENKIPRTIFSLVSI